LKKKTRDSHFGKANRPRCKNEPRAERDRRIQMSRGKQKFKGAKLQSQHESYFILRGVKKKTVKPRGNANRNGNDYTNATF